MKLVITWIFLSEEEYLHSHHHYLEGSLLNHQILHKSFLGKSLSFLLQGFSGNLEGVFAAASMAWSCCFLRINCDISSLN